jgi:pectate lyase
MARPDLTTISAYTFVLSIVLGACAANEAHNDDTHSKAFIGFCASAAGSMVVSVGCMAADCLFSSRKGYADISDNPASDGRHGVSCN